MEMLGGDGTGNIGSGGWETAGLKLGWAGSGGCWNWETLGVETAGLGELGVTALGFWNWGDWEAPELRDAGGAGRWNRQWGRRRMAEAPGPGGAGW